MPPSRIWQFVCLALSLLGLSGCRNINPQIIWSAAVKSPDGRFVASARTYANSGFGVDGVPGTFVYLNWAEGSQKPLEIMEFADESGDSNAEKVVMQWLSGNELEISYTKANQEIEFQAVRFSDVTIRLRALD